MWDSNSFLTTWKVQLKTILKIPLKESHRSLKTYEIIYYLIFASFVLLNNLFLFFSFIQKFFLLNQYKIFYIWYKIIFIGHVISISRFSILNCLLYARSYASSFYITNECTFFSSFYSFKSEFILKLCKLIWCSLFYLSNATDS